MDLIKREDAIKVTWQEPSYTDAINALTEVRDRLKDIPAVEPKRGEWITEERDSIYGKKIRLKCSECGDVFDVSERAFPYERYCRYCGCRMKGADNEID